MKFRIKSARDFTKVQANRALLKFNTFVRGSYYGLENTLYTSGILDYSKMDFPDFLCVGTQKSGTTWLHANLMKHPDIYLPDFKEVHYFDRVQKKHSLKWYSNIFKRKGKNIAGDITPAYCASCTDLELMKILIPDTKIIFLMRNPIDRAWSASKMSLLTTKKLDEVPADKFKKHFNSIGSLDRGDYINIYKRYESTFGQENIFVGFFEEIERNPKKLLIDILSFLKVSTELDWTQFDLKKKVNAAVSQESIPAEYRQMLEDIYCDKINLYKDFFGSYAQEWVCNCD